MLDKALSEIAAREAEQRARRREAGRTREVRLIDAWLDRVETILEAEEPDLSPHMRREIQSLLNEIDPHFGDEMAKGPPPAQVLDLLFDAQERVLPRATRSEGSSQWPPAGSPTKKRETPRIT